MSTLDWDRLLGVAADATPGWFGKLPVLGDFANRRLPQTLVDVLDGWLSQGMAASRAQLGDAWLNTYLTGPLWRFALSPEVADPAGGPDAPWWFGLLMPSVDSVGRYFPLLVLQPSHLPPDSAESLQALAHWYSHVGGAVLGTLQPGASVESFEADLARAPVWGSGAPSERPELQALPGRDRYVLPGQPGLAQWAAGVGLRGAMSRCKGHSLWWPDQATASDTSLSIAPGLPAAEHFALLLEGQW